MKLGILICCMNVGMFETENFSVFAAVSDGFRREFCLTRQLNVCR